MDHSQISCSVGEMHENWRFFLNKSLFLKEAHVFLCSTCRVQRILSIENSFEGITRGFKGLLWIIPELSCPLPKCKIIDVSSGINHYFTKKHTCSCVLPEVFNECYRLSIVLEEKHEFSESYHRSYPIFRGPFSKCTKIDVSSRINHYFSKKHTCSCVLLVGFHECYRVRLVWREYLNILECR